MKLSVLLGFFMAISLANIVNAADCCDAFNTNCCGKCVGGKYDGQECSSRGNSHDLKCCECTGGTTDDFGGCFWGWKC